jgi:ureidoglycolate lyase
MHIGTWHEFPFALDAPADMVIVLRNETNRNLDAIEDGEAVGEDLEKRSIARRFGVTLRVQPPMQALRPAPLAR